MSSKRKIQPVDDQFGMGQQPVADPERPVVDKLSDEAPLLAGQSFDDKVKAELSKVEALES